MKLSEAAEKPPLLTDDELSEILQHEGVRRGYGNFVELDRFMDKAKLPALYLVFSRFGLQACMRVVYESPWHSAARVGIEAFRALVMVLGYGRLSRLQATAAITLVLYYRYFLEYKTLPYRYC